jgi:serine-type D-Ala-D-Ala carboxypeptidase
MRRKWLLGSIASISLILSSSMPTLEAAPVVSSRHQQSEHVKKLANTTANQDLRFAGAFAEVNKWIGQGAFPGAVLAVGQHGQLVALKSFGKMEYTETARQVPVDAIFDLASLSKVIGTTTAVEILYDRKKLDLDAPVVKYIPEFAGTPGHEKILVRHLLTHSSGLNSREAPWQHAKDRQQIMDLLYKMPVDWAPGTKVLYSDYNMMLMGEIVYRISGQRLDHFLAKNVFGPLRMEDTGYNPPEKLLDLIPPTEQDDVFRHVLVHGVVHDKNAFVMGGVSGHAGLFSSASDLAKFAQMYLNGGTYGGKRIISEETIDLFMQRQLSPAGTSRAIGWDTAVKGSFAGDLASPWAIIHTGFTGTSIYIDPNRDAFIILLTNRVNPSRKNVLINEARPAIHTAVLETLDQGRQ